MEPRPLRQEMEKPLKILDFQRLFSLRLPNPRSGGAAPNAFRCSRQVQQLERAARFIAAMFHPRGLACLRDAVCEISGLLCLPGLGRAGRLQAFDHTTSSP